MTDKTLVLNNKAVDIVEANNTNKGYSGLNNNNLPSKQDQIQVAQLNLAITLLKEGFWIAQMGKVGL